MDSILDKKVGSRIQIGRIVDLQVKKQPDRDGVEFDKLMLSVEVNVNTKLDVDEAWVRNRKGVQVSADLWLECDVNGDILEGSTIGKMMRFYNASTVRELVGREVQLYPKKNTFLAVIAVKDFEQDEE